jgi:hypothetical protein
MSSNKCFSNSNKNQSNASDYTIETKQSTIFTGITKGEKYNKNFVLKQCNNGSKFKTLTSAKSYESLLDVSKGRRYVNPLLPLLNSKNALNSNEMWSGNLYSIDYSANKIANVVDTSYNGGNSNKIIFPMTQTQADAYSGWTGLYPGVVIDPSYRIFYESCINSTNGQGPQWRNLVDISYNTNSSNSKSYYKKNMLNANKLYGMNYPEQIAFDISCNTSS